jgi:hypothetical protein
MTKEKLGSLTVHNEVYTVQYPSEACHKDRTSGCAFRTNRPKSSELVQRDDKLIILFLFVL